MYKQNRKLAELFDPPVSEMGCRLWGIEQVMQAGHALIRLYIDRENGVTLADCERVSDQISGLLDVEDPFRGAYILEVSSPGLDRPLFTLEQFAEYKGLVARVNLGTRLEGRRKITGTIVEIGDDHVVLDEEGRSYTIPAGSIDFARLVPELRQADSGREK